MGILITVQGRELLLPRRFSIEWEENNYAFDEDSIYGDYSIPIDIPTKGNEEALNFIHEMTSPEREKVLPDACYFENGNLRYTGALAILNVNRLTTTVSFLV